ncbi:Scr1 family TA system antitoxin-like transcriptional regulator [Embleya sp. NPDC020630]|uniref:Scr1 family TA system antitoxin-like transcriptional regulator n=1 Tax=Embleya sp. NPDC020630 TaxID=3363979 RepID=UPI00378FA8A5
MPASRASNRSRPTRPTPGSSHSTRDPAGPVADKGDGPGPVCGRPRRAVARPFPTTRPRGRSGDDSPKSSGVGARRSPGALWAERGELLALAHRGQQRGRWQEHADAVGCPLADCLRLERDANHVGDVRMRRQRILREGGPSLWAVAIEGVLRQQVGDPTAVRRTGIAEWPAGSR